MRMGFKAATRSRSEHCTMDCSMVWYLRRWQPTPAFDGSGDPALQLRGEDLAHPAAAEAGRESVVEVGPVRGQAGGLRLPEGSQPDGGAGYVWLLQADESTGYELGLARRRDTTRLNATTPASVSINSGALPS